MRHPSGHRHHVGRLPEIKQCITSTNRHRKFPVGGFVLWQIKSRSRHAQRPRNHLCKPDMTQHDCLGKNCRHFEKYEDAGYSFLKSLLSVMLVILPNSDLFHYSKIAAKTQLQPSGAFRTAASRSSVQCLSPFCRFNSASSAFISAISTFSFSSHSSRVCAYTFRACFLPSIHVGE